MANMSTLFLVAICRNSSITVFEFLAFICANFICSVFRDRLDWLRSIVYFHDGLCNHDLVRRTFPVIHHVVMWVAKRFAMNASRLLGFI